MFDDKHNIAGGNLTDHALLKFLGEETYMTLYGNKDYTVTKSQSFNSSNKFSQSYLKGVGKTFYKGAPERLVTKATKALDANGKVVKIDKEALNAKIDDLAKRAMRVLAFGYSEKEMVEDPTEVFVLPYFGGASTPYQDLNAKGAILNLTTETTDSKLYQSVLEGAALEMRLNAEVVSEYGMQLKKLVATGGGANSDKWLQIKANAQKVPVYGLRSAEGGLCGCAMLQAVALGGVSNLREAKEKFVRYTKSFLPNESVQSAYDKKYEKYKKLYTTLKEFN